MYFSSVSIVDFKQVDVNWELLLVDKDLLDQ